MEDLEALKANSFKRAEPQDQPVHQVEKDLIMYRTVEEIPEPCDMLPYVSRGNFDIWLRDNAASYADSLKKLKACAVVNSIGHIGILKEQGLKVIGGPSLNVTNRKTLEALMELGLDPVTVTSPELLDKSEMEGLPLMVTESTYNKTSGHQDRSFLV